MIIGISGKKQHGKDLVCKIGQYLSFIKKAETKWTYTEFMEAFGKPDDKYVDLNDISGFKKKMFAEKLKQIVCMLIGCTMEQLEDNTFKNKELGEEWNHNFSVLANGFGIVDWQRHLQPKKYTPKTLMQLIGTDLFRNRIHPNIWINALDVDYTPDANWIITDTRFPNEAYDYIRCKRNGIVLRVNNPRIRSYDTHESETALDNYQHFHAVLNNSGSIEYLIDQVKDLELF